MQKINFNNLFMKKLILGLIVLTSIHSFSQLRAKGDTEITLKIGYSSANYYSTEELDNSPISGINFGIESDYFFNNRWSLHSGLLYQRMGSKISSNYKEKLSYLTIPINANWHFGSTRKWYLNFGPSIGFITSAKAEFKQMNTFDPAEIGFNTGANDIKDLVNTFQLGLNYGIGYKIFINDKFSLSIDYQGMTGLSEVPKESDFTLKNVYSSFNIGGVIKL